MMRKLFAVLLGMVVLILPIACAESIDVTALSDEDLVSLFDSIQHEMESRDLSDCEVIYQGTYVTGKDIKAGRYNLYVTKCDESLGHVYVEIIDSEENLLEAKNLDYGDTFSFSLNDGDVLTILSGTCIIESPTSSFAP